MSDRLVRDVSTHFRFGENWHLFAQSLTDKQISDAEFDVAALLGCDNLRGRTFLDIGSGSGLHSLAALRLGARRVLAVDFDPDSVRTSRDVLRRRWHDNNWEVKTQSVFDLTPERDGVFDIVYSWGCFITWAPCTMRS